MEENEKEEVEETTVEDTEEESTEENEDEESNDSPTLEDYNELEKKLKTLEAQKKHWRKKAESSTNVEPKAETNKTNNEYLTREEAVLLAKGYDEEDLTRLNNLANGKKLTEVVNDEMFIAWKEKKDKKVKANKAQLGSSKGSTSKSQKPISEMTRDEHKAYWEAHR